MNPIISVIELKEYRKIRFDKAVVWIEDGREHVAIDIEKEEY